MQGPCLIRKLPSREMKFDRSIECFCQPSSLPPPDCGDARVLSMHSLCILQCRSSCSLQIQSRAERSNCCADRQCRNHPSRLIVLPPSPDDKSICRLVTTDAFTHGQLSRAVNSSGSKAESPLSAEDPTVAPHVAEEVPNEHTNAPHSTSTTTGALSTSGTKIGALLNLSQETDEGEVHVSMEVAGSGTGPICDRP